MPEPQALPADLVAEGHEIPIARVQAMHEGKRRARAQREADAQLSQKRNSSVTLLAWTCSRQSPTRLVGRC